jgi:molybdenum cofactor synthesis domain-containing protein
MNDTTAALLVVGNEILTGKVDDANGPFLIRALRARGVRLVEVRVLDDVPAIIEAAVRELSPRVTHLFTTGGIGPTHDDVTVASVAAAFDKKLVRHPGLVDRLREYYGDRLNDARLRLAEVPDGADVLLGEERLLPVIRIANTTIFPGPPSLMRLCFERIAHTLSGTPFVSRGLLVNASESTFAQALTEVQRAHPLVAIGSYPRFDHDAPYRVKLTVDGRDVAAVEAALAAVRAILEPELILGEA